MCKFESGFVGGAFIPSALKEFPPKKEWSLPSSKVSPLEIQDNFIRIKNEAMEIIESELERIRKDPELAHWLFVRSSATQDSLPKD